ncbi:MAG TPA: type VI secretion system baseplate subunit TssF [Pyrinomonadaceae bacterium]|nr:type VI secretion system baseplate subunit TssF [Pyrinomonadaceae bacterium]
MKTSQHEELLRYYRSELNYLRRMGGEFAALYPRVASRLELGRDECADPQVERLIESFAFLTARLQRDLDGEFPEVTTALLGVLYPQFTAPVPPMAVARFDVDPDQGKLTTGFTLPRHTPLFAYTRQGHACRFRTCYPVTLWPLTLTYAAVEDTGQFDFLDRAANVAAVLRLKLRCDAGYLSELELKRLRFYLDGDAGLLGGLYELLFSNVVDVVALTGSEARPVQLPRGSILPVGFGDDEEVLPYPRQSHPGYRLLHEYFAFPAKYHFFDLDNLDLCRRGRELDILFLLDKFPAGAEFIGPANFVLGCTPVINLFRKTTEPIRLDHRTAEYRLVPDKRRERTTEIHSVLSVTASSADDDRTRRFEPFYSYSHGMDGGADRAFWHARRAVSLNKDVSGTEVFLSFLDLDFRPSLPPAQTVYAHTLCTNRELAAQLPAGAALQIEEQAPLVGISCLTKPTLPHQPPLRGETLWRLISHLSLNHLSLSEGADSLPALREILKLYSPVDSPSAQQQIAGLRSMECRPVVRRVGRDAWRGFCRGTEITLEFDEDLYVGSGAFLLGAVLERFFALYASINSFTQLRIKSRQREGVWKQWPPTVGEKIAL